MTVDELMQLLEEIPYFTEVRLAAKMTNGPPHDCSISGVGQADAIAGIPPELPLKIWLFATEPMQALPNKLWVPAFRRTA